MDKQIVIYKKPKNQPKKVTTEVINIQTGLSNQKKSKKSKRRNKGSRNQGQSLRSAERAFFKAALLAPDIFGPIRQPRYGSTRTGLGFDQSETTITGPATTSQVNVVQAGSTYNTAFVDWLAVASTGTAIGPTTGTSGPNVQFPANTQVADVNLVAVSLTAYYTGNPLNVQGEVIFGSTIPLANGATYASLYYYPGTRKMPVAQLIQRPLRVSMRKLSPIADEFVPVATGNADVDLPFLACTGLPSGGTLNIVITRTWEYRSTTVSGSEVPYEAVGASHSGDIAAFEDARADVGAMDSIITRASPEGEMGGFLEGLGMSNLGFIGGAASGLAVMGNYFARRAQQGHPQSAFGAGVTRVQNIRLAEMGLV